MIDFAYVGSRNGKIFMQVAFLCNSTSGLFKISTFNFYEAPTPIALILLLNFPLTPMLYNCLKSRIRGLTVALELCQNRLT